MSILEFPPLDLGKVLRPLKPEDDLLDEMLTAEPALKQETSPAASGTI